MIATARDDEGRFPLTFADKTVLARLMLARVTKPRSIRPLGRVDVDRVLPLVRRLSEQAWASEDGRKENAFGCFHHTRHIVFRFIPGFGDPRDFYSNPSWVVWSQALLPVMEAAIVPFGFDRPVFPKVMLARLEAGHKIDRHRDGAGSNLHTHKIHVPLVSNERALIEAGGQSMHLAVGHAYEINNIVRHGAVNQGDEDRIHLIFEVFDDRTGGQPGAVTNE